MRRTNGTGCASPSVTASEPCRFSRTRRRPNGGPIIRLVRPVGRAGSSEPRAVPVQSHREVCCM